MNIIFLTLNNPNIEAKGIYSDLLRKFRNEGHSVYIVHPNERRSAFFTELVQENGICRLGVRSLNIQKTNLIEKGIATLFLEYLFILKIQRHFKNLSFDLILYSTPPVTFSSVIKYLKRRNKYAITYLLLKDIFPQNAVDINLLSKLNPIYWYFKRKEKTLYKKSDYIGCMSPANVQYILKNNSYLRANKVCIAPNSIEVKKVHLGDKEEIKKKYGLPVNCKILIYGGNLGKPQGIDYLINCLEHNKDREDCFFLIIGNGTEFYKLLKWFNLFNPKNIKILSEIPKEDYDLLIQACDIGLIFLDHRFTIPNFPSRLLSYLENKIPVIAATDICTDIGEIIQFNKFGFWCESVNPVDFTNCINKYIQQPSLICTHGENGYDFLLKNYQIEQTYNAIINCVNIKCTN